MSLLVNHQDMSQFQTKLRKSTFFKHQMLDSELLSTMLRALPSKIWLKWVISQQVMNLYLTRQRRSMFYRHQMQDIEPPSTLNKILLKLEKSQQVMNQSQTKLKKSMFFKLQMLDIELLSTLNKILLKLEKNQLVMSLSLMRPRKFMSSKLQMLDIGLLSMLKLILSPLQLLLFQLDQRKFPFLKLQLPRLTLHSTTSKELLQPKEHQRRRRLTQLAQRIWTHGYTRPLKKIPVFSQILTMSNYSHHMDSWLSLLIKEKLRMCQNFTSRKIESKGSHDLVLIKSIERN
jgi:hypothetical protein